MKTLEQIKQNYKSRSFDQRDLIRLLDFFTEKEMKKIWNVELMDEYKGKHKQIPFTRENILKQLEKDVAFGFEKALDKKSLSASCMFGVIAMWNWILEEGLENFDEDNYAQYGLPLLKATALKYGFQNPIGEDTGKEKKYASY